MTLLAERQKCSSCKMVKMWASAHKTCDECRERARQSKPGPKRGDLTMEEALEVVKRAESGLHDEDLAKLLRVSPETFEQWREQGRNSVSTEDPYYLIYWEVDKVRVRVFSEMLEKWKESPNPTSQIAWMKYAFPDKQPMRPPAAPKIPDRPQTPQAGDLQELVYI